MCLSGNSIAQTSIVDLSAVDGVDITPDNIFNYTVQYTGTAPVEMLVKGVIHYRSSDLGLEYSFRTRLQPGINSFNSDKLSPQFQFSSSALKELFLIYKMLPFGTYQYCVTVGANGGGDGGTNGAGDCLYRKSEDQFMISLVDPENDAKLYEYNPVLSWIATYSFSDALTYKLRVAEIKEGQTTASAIARNNPMYAEKGLTQNSMVYPIYAKPLTLNQPYAWTVDAYYKGILLGGAEPWKFTIVEDTTIVVIERDQPHYEFNKHYGETTLHAIGELKLKYVSEANADSLFMELFDAENVKVNVTLAPYLTQYDDNLFALDLLDKLKHRKKYSLVVRNISGKTFTIPFIYYNPLYVK
jgi:hypothetical protein